MAHYAIIDPETKIVVNVFVGKDEGEGIDWEQEYSKFHPGFIIKRTSYNTLAGVHWMTTDLGPLQRIASGDQSKALRKNFAKKGSIYNEEIDGFIEPQPFPSWTLNKIRGIWEPPFLPIPISPSEHVAGVNNIWNEELKIWEKKIRNKETGELENYTGGLNPIID